jgi:hypothetical protein
MRRAKYRKKGLGESVETVRVTYPGSLLPVDRVRLESAGRQQRGASTATIGR